MQVASLDKQDLRKLFKDNRMVVRDHFQKISQIYSLQYDDRSFQSDRNGSWCPCEGTCPKCQKAKNITKIVQAKSEISKPDEIYEAGTESDTINFSPLNPVRNATIGSMYDGREKSISKKKESVEPNSNKQRVQAGRAQCDKDCPGGAHYGAADCVLDTSGLPTDKVNIEVYESNSCTRPCVEVHESTHERDIKNICSTAYRCLKRAGKNENKQNKCLDTYEEQLYAKTFATECNGYTDEQACLNKRKSRPECNTTEGKASWLKHSQMVKCYKSCFCRLRKRSK